MNKHLLLAAAATLAFTPAAFAQDAKPMAGDRMATEKMAGQNTQLSAADRNFIEKAAIGGMFEVQSSELALEKGQSDAVKTFAQRMVDDHGKANSELKSAVNDLGGQLPTKLDAKHEQAMGKLRSANGADFDTAYVMAQRDAHKDAVNLFSSYSRSNGNPQLTAWAAETLLTLEMHQQRIQNIGGMAEGATDTGRASTNRQMNDNKAPMNSK